MNLAWASGRARMKQYSSSNRQEKFPPTLFFFLIQAFNSQGEAHSHQRGQSDSLSLLHPSKNTETSPSNQPVVFKFILFYNWYSGLLGSCLLLCLFCWFLQQKSFLFVFYFDWTESSLGWVSSLVTVYGLL